MHDRVVVGVQRGDARHEHQHYQQQHETCKTPAGTFSGCMKVKEGSALKAFESEYKYYAPGIGLVRDEDLRLVKYGFLKDK